MPQLLLEILSEEIPARMQAGAARDLERLFRDRMGDAGLPFDTVQTFAGPRRLTLVAEGLPAAQGDQVEELKGPKASAPPQALEGFLRKTGLTRDQLTERDGVLYARVEREGRPTPEIIAEIVERIVREFPWPKSMRWGTGTLRWVRPIRRILCLFDGRVVPFAIDGIESGHLTEGHRFHGSGAPVRVAAFADYRANLEAERVVLCAEDRKRLILDRARALCAEQGLELVEDDGLLEEVAGLAEFPRPILGRMDEAFLTLPPEVIRTSMRTHQKYFAVRKAGHTSGTLAPYFVTVSNVEATDGGAAIAAGNARVLSARLNDARFFWDEDLKTGFGPWLKKLEGVTFHAKLGTMKERVDRIAALAREIAPLVGADPDLAEQAARLAKADLASGMVGEFPELQGVMGGYYARALRPGAFETRPAAAPQADETGAGPQIFQTLRVEEGERALRPGAFETRPAAAPQADETGAGPQIFQTRQAEEGALAPVSKPAFGYVEPEPWATGQEDPFAGVERLGPLASEPVHLDGKGKSRAEIDQIADAIRDHYRPQGPNDAVPREPLTVAVALADKLDTLVGFFAIDEKPTGSKDPYALRRAALGVIRILLTNGVRVRLRDVAKTSGSAYPARFPESEEGKAAGDIDLLHFFADRLKVLLRDEGRRHDLVDAVFALGDDDLVRVVARVEALSGFLATDDGANLLAGYKRATNILKAEAKKNAAEEPLYGEAVDAALLAEPEERALNDALAQTLPEVERRLAAEDFTGAMGSLAGLRAPVDAFFDRVLVNAPEAPVRLNRLRLLSAFRCAADRVADFSQVSG